MPNKPHDRSDETTRLLAEGQAGLRLTESLMLALVDAKILDKDGALEAIEIVIADNQAMAAEGGSPEMSRATVALLTSIRTSVAAARVDAAAGAKHGRRVHRARSS